MSTVCVSSMADLADVHVMTPANDTLVDVLAMLAKAMRQLDDAPLDGCRRLADQRDTIVDQLGHVHHSVAELIGERELVSAGVGGLA